MEECLFWTFSAFEILVTVFEQFIIVTCNKLKINEVKCWSNAHTVKYHYQKLQQAFRICSAVVLNIHSYTVSADEVECSCHFAASGRNFMTHCQVLKDFLIYVKYHSIRTLKSMYLYCNRCCLTFKQAKLHFIFFLMNFKNLLLYAFL